MQTETEQAVNIKVHVMPEWEREAATAVLQHPDVASFTLVDGVDIAALDVSNFPDALIITALFDDVVGAVWLFIPRGRGTYDVHTNILPKYRGKLAMDAAKACMHHLFTKTDCTTLVTSCPVNNIAAASYAKKLGFSYAYTVPEAFTQQGKSWDIGVYYLTIVGWALRYGDNWAHLGHDFHKQIEETNHEDDPRHDACVGVALEVGRHNHVKGMWLYNQLAPLFGYVQLAMLQDTPNWSLIHMQDVIIKLSHDPLTVESLHLEA